MPAICEVGGDCISCWGGAKPEGGLLTLGGVIKTGGLTGPGLEILGLGGDDDDDDGEKPVGGGDIFADIAGITDGVVAPNVGGGIGL